MPDEPLDVFGHWWLPEKPTQVVAGQLKFDSIKGGTLELSGSLQDVPLGSASVVLGETTSGREITLLNCLGTRSTGFSQGINKTTYYTSRVLSGLHVSEGDETLVEGVDFTFPQLNDWIDELAFEVKHHPELTISWKDLDRVGLLSEDGVEISLSHGHSENLTRSSFSLEQFARFYIKSSEPKTLYELRRVVTQIQFFLCLATSQPTYAESIEMHVPAEPGSPLPYRSIQLFEHHQEPRYTGSIWMSQLFSYQQIKLELPSILSKWLANGALLQPVYDLYFAVEYSPHVFGEHRFLSVVQGLKFLPSAADWGHGDECA